MAGTRASGARMALAACALLAMACSGAVLQADSYFSRGDYLHAATAYEASLASGTRGGPSARTLYRLAVARATPGTEAYDPAKAAAAFDRLARSYPTSDYAKKAALPASLVRELMASTERLRELQLELERSKAELEGILKSSGEENQGLRQDLDERKSQILQLKARVAEQEQAIARLRAEMEQYKRIDLGAPVR